MFDTSQTGKIRASDVGTAVRAIGQNPSESEVKTMVQEADKKGTGYVTEADFVAMVSRHWQPVEGEDDLVEAFQQYDREGTGYIDVKHLRHVLVNLGEKMEEKEVDELIREAKPDSDGQLNYTSLTQLLLSNAK
ncbi:CALM-like protein [Mya arenaria]|uniref:CALM-like protein n=2 Tax=Mya arenaria TaxID=6604 RepID=A0ABY7FFB6_MYAAR|nr:CALM-like protein [Mya arenaria]